MNKELHMQIIILLCGKSSITISVFFNILAVLDEITPEVVKATIKAVMKETALKGKFVFMPIRVALTGQMHGPDLNNIVTLLGKEKCLHRLDNVSALTKQ